MKVILLEDVKSLGKKGQLVEVNAGYARNFILPKKLGVEATNKNINDLKLQKAHEDKVAAEQLAAAKVLAEELKDKSVELKIQMSEHNTQLPALQNISHFFNLRLTPLCKRHLQQKKIRTLISKFF